jgi:hypothetical protein
VLLLAICMRALLRAASYPRVCWLHVEANVRGGRTIGALHRIIRTSNSALLIPA